MTDSIPRPAASLLRLTQVKARTGLSRSTIYLRIKAGEFPAQVYQWTYPLDQFHWSIAAPHRTARPSPS